MRRVGCCWKIGTKIESLLFFIGAGADKKKNRFRNTGFDLDGVAACWYGDCGGGSQQAGWQDPPLHDPLLRDVRA